jgi:hypothetical protein
MQQTAEVPEVQNAGNAPTVSPPMGYRELAWWPEIADGSEGKDLVIAVGTENGTTTAHLETKNEATSRGHQIVLEGIRVNPAVPPKRKPVEQILIKVQGDTEPKPATYENHRCDAIFVTPGAVRKFVELYYESHRLLNPQERQALDAAIADPDVPAIGHVYPSRSGGVGLLAELAVLWAEHDPAGGFIGTRWQSLYEYYARQVTRSGRR